MKMKLRPKWRRFRPIRARLGRSVPSSQAVNVFTHVEERLKIHARFLVVKRLRKFDVSQLHDTIRIKRLRAGESDTVVDWLELLVLQAPGAVRAQRHMDKHPGGPHASNGSLYDLINFNDAYVSAVLSAPAEILPVFDEQAKQLIDRFCRRLRTPSFSDEQWEAITRGLSKEIAVYRGAIGEGLKARMTSSSQDAMGVDLIVGDPTTGREVNIDVKTRSSFHFRIKDLVSEGRVSEVAQEHAEQVGYLGVTNGHGGEAVDVVLVRVSDETLGEVVNFEFENSALLGRELRKIIAELGHPARTR